MMTADNRDGRSVRVEASAGGVAGWEEALARYLPRLGAYARALLARTGPISAETPEELALDAVEKLYEVSGGRLPEGEEVAWAELTHALRDVTSAARRADKRRRGHEAEAARGSIVGAG